MIRDANALLRRYQDEAAATLTRALCAEQELAETKEAQAALAEEVDDLRAELRAMHEEVDRLAAPAPDAA